MLKMQKIYNNHHNGTKQTMESQDKAFILELLGWSRGGKTNHLPDDIIGVIKKFTFYDTRSEAYYEHLEKKRKKKDMHWVLDDILYEINNDINRYETGEYGVEYNPIITTSKCCYRCGDFIPTRGQLSINTKCVCDSLTEEEMMELLYKREEQEERIDELSNKTYAQYMEEMRKERLEEEMCDEDWY